MRADEWLVKARLLEVGETLQVSCISVGEAHTTLGRINTILRGTGFPDYSLVAYTKPQETSSTGWWLCIAKVPRTDIGYVKTGAGDIQAEGNSFVTLDAQRLFHLAIKDGKSEEELFSLAVSELEKRYIKELLKSKRPVVIKLEGIGD